MLYRKLGNSGLDVSVLGLGTNQFGGKVDEAQTARIIDQAIDIGLNFIDTANMYGGGKSELFIGNAVKGAKRHKVVIGTKWGYMGSRNQTTGDGSRQSMFQWVEESLRRLSTDYIDLYMLHRGDSNTPVEETLRGLDDLVHAGKVRYAGVSNLDGWQLVEAAHVAKAHRLNPFVSVQNAYSLLHRRVEAELVPACLACGVSLIPYSPLQSGVLTGKYKAGQPAPSGSRLAGSAYASRVLTDDNLMKAETLEHWALAHGRTLGELAHAWLLANPAVDTVISGATKPEQIVDNAKGVDWVLTPAELAEIDKLVPR